MLVSYNGVLLPSYPSGITVDEYPYIWIRDNNYDNSYNLICSNVPFFYQESTNYIRSTRGTEKWYSISKSSTIDDSTEWTYKNTNTGGDYWTLDSKRTVLWSLYDIPIGSETGTEIYYYGSEPVVPTSNKYLVRSSGIIYTISNNELIQLETSYVSSQLFIDSGIDDIPSWELISSLTDPEILVWSDEDVAPTMQATVNATPNRQNIISDMIDISSSDITGIESATANCEEELIVAVSFDDMESWKAWNGEQWITLSDNYSGMSKESLESITIDQWNELFAGATGFFIRVSLINSTQILENIVIDFSN